MFHKERNIISNFNNSMTETKREIPSQATKNKTHISTFIVSSTINNARLIKNLKRGKSSITEALPSSSELPEDAVTKWLYQITPVVCSGNVRVICRLRTTCD